MGRFTVTFLLYILYVLFPFYHQYFCFFFGLLPSKAHLETLAPFSLALTSFRSLEGLGGCSRFGRTLYLLVLPHPPTRVFWIFYSVILSRTLHLSVIVTKHHDCIMMLIANDNLVFPFFAKSRGLKIRWKNVTIKDQLFGFGDPGPKFHPIWWFAHPLKSWIIIRHDPLIDHWSLLHLSQLSSPFFHLLPPEYTIRCAKV